MKKIIIITSSLFLGLIVVWIAIMMVTYMIDSHKIDNDPTLYNGFKIIEEKQITAEDGLTFYTLQVDMNHPKTPYRLYVFPTKKKENHLFYVDSYMDKFKPSISYIIRSDNGGYYVIEDYIVNYNNGGFTTIAAGYLDSFEPTEENFLEYVPVVKKLVERGSWFWLYEGAEFLLKSEE